MPTSFVNRASKDVGTTPVLMYTTPADSKSILIGANIANILGSTVPFDLYINKSGVDYYIVLGHRVTSGNNIEVMSGNKIVLDNNDTVYVKSHIPSGVDVTLSILSGVT